MAAPRLSDEQKVALVERYRAGAAAAELAAAFGCSSATVTRVVKAALEPAEYERLKQGRGRGGSRASAAAAAAPVTVAVDPVAVAVAAAPVAPPADPANDAETDPDPERDRSAAATDAEADDGERAGVLAIDDADDFGDDSDADGEESEPEAGDAEAFVAVPVVPLEVSQELVECRPFEQAPLPASAYLLVDKTVELEARPLAELPELGQLPPEEQERRALVLFANQRQAKQLCGRSQRVIKLPDPWVLHRTARYLVAQGITRVVLEGGVYSLPGS